MNGHLVTKSFTKSASNSQKIHQSPWRLVDRFGLCQLRLLLRLLRRLRGGTELRRLNASKGRAYEPPNVEERLLIYTNIYDTLSSMHSIEPQTPFFHMQRGVKRVWCAALGSHFKLRHFIECIVVDLKHIPTNEECTQAKSG